ncbi:RIP metalloprotease RseP [Alloprevotella sp. OH1205_COT-284]|uniref:RIP metalloprotease RseP n=1 Tax=Alloprevotella sp. OH1205_COT-284 TaxID=2491043 RepID=UPI000F5F1E86|nr:RIP metalloprotease RseP [Alloprevotella sp. OH1205_COT-284]RRD80283.1 RIP metalloprotease RseP [Alloprevotella sp. OH1205_COT-284]
MEIFLIKALQLILSISLLVVLHEFGHFFFAKLFGIRVHRFCLFFDFWKGGRKALPLGRWGNTDFAIGWLPLGGYVDIAGMVDESTGADAVAKEEAKIPAGELFKNKPAWQRLLVMVGGVLVNFLFALFVYSMVMLAWGEERLPVRNITHGFSFSPTAEQMGFRDGDLIVGADNETYTYFNQTRMLRDLGKAEVIHVMRNGQRLDIPLDGNIDLLKMVKEQPPFVALTTPSIVDSVMADGAAAKGGLRSGDRIVGMNGKTISTWNEIDEQLAVVQDQIAAVEGKVEQKVLKTTLLVERKGTAQIDTLAFALSNEGKLGVFKHNVLADYATETISHNLLSCFPAGITHGWEVLSGYVSDLRYIFSAEGVKSVGSFGTIGSIFPATWDWAAFWQLTAFISLMLAFMNFLPIPMLDGGYIFITLLEVVTRRKFSDKWIERVNTVGFYFVLGLMALGLFNDIVRFVF